MRVPERSAVPPSESPVDRDVAVDRTSSIGTPTTLTGDDDASVSARSGARVGRYEIVDVLGEGGVGVIYRAHDPYLSRDVALKLIPARGNADAGWYQACLLREAQALAKLSHPNVVAAFDVGTHDERVYVAMEVVEGVSLHTWLASPRSRRDIVRVLIAAGRGLAAAHAAGVMHRDFKPSNVMVSPDGRVRVVDFGLARALAADVAPDALPTHASAAPARASGDHLPLLWGDLTVTGAVMGTPGYMAPEQLLGDDVDGRADQYAFAATAFYALAGRRVFPGTTIESYRAAVMTGQRAPWPRGVPRRLRRVIERGLAPRPDRRFSSVSTLVDALERTTQLPRRMATGASLAAAAAVMALALAWPEPARPPLCAPHDAAFDPGWSAARRAALAHAFTSAGAPGGFDTAARVSARLDAVRTGWLVMSQTNCEDTLVRRRQSERVMALRAACLDRKRAEVAAFVDTLSAQPAATLIERAGLAALEIGQLDDCAGASLLVAGDDRLPTDPAQRGAVVALGARIDAVHVATLVGQQDALPRARALVVDAERLRFPVTLARAHIELGAALAATGHSEDAQASLHAALRAAGQSDAPALAAQAAAMLLHAAIQGDRYAEAEHILPFVQAAVSRDGVSMHSIAALIDEAAVLANRSEFDGALALLARAEAQADTLGSRAASEKLRTVTERAITLEAKGDDRGAERAYRRALELSRALHGPRHRAVLRAASNLVQALSNSGQHDAALAALRDARALGAEFAPATVEVIALEAIEGNAWQLHGDCARALPFFEAALDRFSAVLGPTSNQVTRMHIRLGKCLLATGHPAAAVPHFSAWYERKIAEHATPDWQAEAGFWLAKALWQLPPSRRRAAAIAETALARYQEAGATYAAEAAEIAAWLAARGAGARPATTAPAIRER